MLCKARPAVLVSSSLPQALRLTSTVAPTASSYAPPPYRNAPKGKHSSPARKASWRTASQRPPAAEGPDASKRLLTPYVLSGRLQKLCDDDQLDAAVDMLQNAPLDAQNVPVWNNVIREALIARRSKLAYQLFVDVR